jgi:hypothetical protein
MASEEAQNNLRTKYGIHPIEPLRKPTNMSTNYTSYAEDDKPWSTEPDTPPIVPVDPVVTTDPPPVDPVDPPPVDPVVTTDPPPVDPVVTTDPPPVQPEPNYPLVNTDESPVVIPISKPIEPSNIATIITDCSECDEQLRLCNDKIVQLTIELNQLRLEFNQVTDENNDNKKKIEELEEQLRLCNEEKKNLKKNFGILNGYLIKIYFKFYKRVSGNKLINSKGKHKGMFKSKAYIWIIEAIDRLKKRPVLVKKTSETTYWNENFTTIIGEMDEYPELKERVKKLQNTFNEMINKTIKDNPVPNDDKLIDTNISQLTEYANNITQNNGDVEDADALDAAIVTMRNTLEHINEEYYRLIQHSKHQHNHIKLLYQTNTNWSTWINILTEYKDEITELNAGTGIDISNRFMIRILVFLYGEDNVPDMDKYPSTEELIIKIDNRIQEILDHKMKLWNFIIKLLRLILERKDSTNPIYIQINQLIVIIQEKIDNYETVPFVPPTTDEGHILLSIVNIPDAPDVPDAPDDPDAPDVPVDQLQIEYINTELEDVKKKIIEIVDNNQDPVLPHGFDSPVNPDEDIDTTLLTIENKIKELSELIDDQSELEKVTTEFNKYKKLWTDLSSQINGIMERQSLIADTNANSDRQPHNNLNAIEAKLNEVIKQLVQTTTDQSAIIAAIQKTTKFVDATNYKDGNKYVKNLQLIEEEVNRLRTKIDEHKCPEPGKCTDEECDDRLAQITELTLQITTLNATINEYVIKLKDCEAENEELKKKICAEPKKCLTQDEINDKCTKKHCDDNCTTRDELDRLIAAAVSTAQKGKLTEANAVFQKTHRIQQAEKDKKFAEMKDQGQGIITGLNKDLDKLKAELKRVNVNLLQATNENAAMKTQIANMKKVGKPIAGPNLQPEIDRLRKELARCSSSPSSDDSGPDVNLMQMTKNKQSLIQLILLLYRKHNDRISNDKLSEASMRVLDINGLLNHLKNIWNKIGNRELLSSTGTVPWHRASPWLMGVILWVNETKIRQLPEFKSDDQYHALAHMTHPHTASKLSLLAGNAGILPK